MVGVLATSRGFYGHYSWRLGIVSPHFSSVSRGCFVGTHTFGVCVCDYLREADNQSYSPHPPRGRGYHTEVDVQGRHERGYAISFRVFVT
jgi:hypothetical protein